MSQSTRLVNDLPPHFRVLYGESTIRARVRELGGEIRLWAQEVWDRSHTELLAIPILRGGIFFFADLAREISSSIEIFPSQASAFWRGDDGRAVRRDKIEVDVRGVPAEGRSILLVDDVCDSGASLQEVARSLMGLGAREVRAAVLIRRVVPKQLFEPYWAGFAYNGPEWFVGYGMDDADRWRNLPSVYIIARAADE